jgi:hypothetical protein
MVQCIAEPGSQRAAGQSGTGPHRPRSRTHRFRLPVSTAVGLVAVVGMLCVGMPVQAEASSPADEGVTSTSIRIGIPVINFAALESVGVTLNDGNFKDAFDALTASMNAHGGIDGRKVVPYFVETNPAVASSGDSSCSELTEDDKVFIVMFPVYPDCYQQDHDTPVIGGVLPGPLPANAAPDFSLTPPDAVYDPVQLAAFSKRGVFKGKKVGIFYGADAEASEVKVVQADLKKLHVDVVLSAADSGPATDTVAIDQDAQTIALRFKSAGVNEVVGVGGTGATVWPRALQDTQSSYRPSWIATNVTSLVSYVESAKGGNPYLDNVMASTPVPSGYQEWKDPAIQKCAAIVRKAYPSDVIGSPPNPSSSRPSNSADTPYAAVEVACQDLALFAKIAEAAGRNLTVASFTKAGYQLRNVAIPGAGGPVSFGPGRPYAIGTANVVVYDPRSKALVAAPPH